MEQVKTLLLGMLIAVVLMMLMGAGAEDHGRYQIACAGGSIYYILDSHTGKIVAASGGNAGAASGAAAVQAETRF
jgi:hypothetical protein